jgi:mannose-1-phosphate guanylyltransferase / phosphomannomutase
MHISKTRRVGLETVIAVVMAGGEGTRLRPLTSNQPKPMVPIVGKPCMEHIVELLRRNGVDEVVVTLAYLPQAIRSYFGDGSALGVSMRYSVEATPLGTAGSVARVAPLLDSTMIVISGDALTDVDLSRVVAFHQERGAMATLAVKSVENPLDFGLVIADEEGRVERFLEKPGWGEVFSDRINTGIYILEPEVLDRIPADEPSDFSRTIFPAILAEGLPIYACPLNDDEYWQDVGSTEQFAQANRDALDGRVRVEIPGVELAPGIWVEDGVTIADLQRISSPCYIGRYATLEGDASVGPYCSIGPNVVIRDGARVERSVIDAGSYLGVRAEVRGAIVGRTVDVHARAQVHEGAVIGDECTIGADAVISGGVRIYPFKQVGAGAQLRQSLVWESRVTPAVLDQRGLSGVANVEVTPERALRLGLAFGTSIGRGERVAVARGASPAARMIKRAVMAGLQAAGVEVADLHHATPSLLRHTVGSFRLAGGADVRVAGESEELAITLLDGAGGLLADGARSDVERRFARGDHRRVTWRDIGTVSELPAAPGRYADALMSLVDADAVRERRFRIVIDYRRSPAASVAAETLTALGVDVIGVNGAESTDGDASSIVPLLVRTVDADLGVCLDDVAEKLEIVEATGQDIDPERMLLVLVYLHARAGLPGPIVVPSVATSLVERVAGSVEVRRAPFGAAPFETAIRSDGATFAMRPGQAAVLPAISPGPDAIATVIRLLGLLAQTGGGTLGEALAAVPQPAVVHARVPCGWAAKGTVMRRLNEHSRRRRTDTSDGLRVYDRDAWVQVVPDAEEPLLHVFAEARTTEAAERLRDRYVAIVSDLLATPEVGAALAQIP